MAAAAASAALLIGAGDAPETAGDYRANFVSRVASRLTWPEGRLPEAPEPVILAVIGDEQYEGGLSYIAKLRVKGRPVRLRKVRSLADIGAPHILFVSDSEARALSEILGWARDKEILTIAEFEDFPKRGGMMNFYEIVVRGKTKVAFEFNREVAEAEGFRIPSYLLQIAEDFKRHKRRR